MNNKNNLDLNNTANSNTPNDSVSKHLNEHLQENMNSIPNNPKGRKNLVVYIAMAVVIIACILIIYIFLDKNNSNPFTKNSTTTIPRANTVLPSSSKESHANTSIVTTSSSVSAKVVEYTTTVNTSIVSRTTFHTVNRN